MHRYDSETRSRNARKWLHSGTINPLFDDLTKNKHAEIILIARISNNTFQIYLSTLSPGGSQK